LHSFVFQQLADAEHVILVTDGDATVHVVGSHDYCNPLRRLRSIGALRFGDEAGIGNSTMHQVFVTHATFAETGISRRAACGYDHGGNSSVEEFKGMIQASPVDRGRPSGVLGGAEDDDGIRVMEFLQRGLMDNLDTDCADPGY
jgi:hypothetical protein